MKKLYSLFLLVLVTVFGFSASAVTITLDIDDASHVAVEVDNEVLTDIVSGVNTLEVEQYATMYVKAIDGYSILSAMNVESGYPMSVYDNQVYVSTYADSSYKIVTGNLAELRNASFTLTINGDASIVRAMFTGTSSHIDVKEGTQTVAFSPEYDKTLALSSSGEKPLYKVMLDGKNVSGDYSYEVLITDGCEVVVEPEFPDTPITINFTYGEGMDDCLDEVSVNYNTITLENNSFVCQPGQNILIYFKSEYAIDEVTFNGEPMNVSYSSAYFTAKESGTIHVEGHKYGDTHFVVNITDPAAITLYQGYSYLEKVITLTAGRNEVSVPENDNMITFTKNSGYVIESITDAEGNDYTVSDNITVHEGMELTFTTAPLALDNTAVVYLDDRDAAQYFFHLQNSSREEMGEFKTGYNTLKFDSSYNPFLLSWGPSANSGVYIDGVQMKSEYETGNNYSLELTDGAVVKVFMAAAPVECNVEFNVAEGCEPEILRDLIVPVDPAVNVPCFNGTQFDITGENLVVKVDDVTLEPAEGKFTFAVEKDAKVDILSSGSDGIDNVAVDGVAGGAVYSMQGIRVANSLKNLPAGIYVTGGKKVMVK